ncbi:hypothetical protein ACQ3I4_01285 [Zafaria sp. Z1313]|uniref:hypothetical protein n=1 Tax=unclassified Zafaria TaxID=2828765 RepID=UPI002E7986E0|nr:hypothetical protein [Zafaria sp. J156]MEE1620014.1 hypothetical protein [Zafaria sp. J156]
MTVPTATSLEKKPGKADSIRPVWKEKPSAPLKLAKFALLMGFAVAIVIPILVAVSTSLADNE